MQIKFDDGITITATPHMFTIENELNKSYIILDINDRPQFTYKQRISSIHEALTMILKGL